MFECCHSAMTQAHNGFGTRLVPVDDTLFEVGPEIRCSAQMCQVSAVVMETTQLVLSQFKNF